MNWYGVAGLEDVCSDTAVGSTRRPQAAVDDNPPGGTPPPNPPSVSPKTHITRDPTRAVFPASRALTFAFVVCAPKLTTPVTTGGAGCARTVAPSITTVEAHSAARTLLVLPKVFVPQFLPPDVINNTRHMEERKTHRGRTARARPSPAR